MEYYSTMKKEQNTGKYYNTNVPQKHYVTWQKLDTKGKGLYSPFYMTYSK